MTPVLLLAGLGHSHLFVLEALRKGELPPCRVLVCSEEAHHVYSGMVPGWLGGRYSPSELTVDIAAICASTGAEYVSRNVAGVDAVSRTVLLSDGTSLPFDVCSIAVGSRPAGVETEGVREWAWPLKPLQRVEGVLRQLKTLAAARAGAVTVVGGGLAGIEVALAARARLRIEGAPSNTVPVRIVNRDAALSTGRGRGFTSRLEDACARHAVAIHHNARVNAVSEHGVQLNDDEQLPSDVTIWATGPAAAPWLANCGLAVDDRGFLLVNEHLQSLSSPHVFAAGDCATLDHARDTPKAGVYAVRMGPHLARSLAQALRGAPVTERYDPQQRWLTLVNTGDGRAVASWGPFTAQGKWAMRWKDKIDRAFMARFSDPVHRPRDGVSR